MLCSGSDQDNLRVKKLLPMDNIFTFNLSKEIAHLICKHVNIYYNDSLRQIFMLFLCWL